MESINFISFALSSLFRLLSAEYMRRIDSRNDYEEARTTSKGLVFTLARTVDIDKWPKTTIIYQTLRCGGFLLDLNTEEKFSLRGVHQESVYLSSTSHGFNFLYRAELKNAKIEMKRIKVIPTGISELLNSPHYLLLEETNLHTVFTYEGEVVFAGMDLYGFDGNDDFSVVHVEGSVAVFILNNTIVRRANATLAICAQEVEQTDLFVSYSTSCIYAFTTSAAGPQDILKVDIKNKQTWILTPRINLADQIRAIEQATEEEIVYRDTNGNRTVITDIHWQISTDFISFEVDKSPYSLEEDYDQLVFLGKGGFGMVMKGRSKKDLFICAIKVVELRKDNTYDLAMREIRAMARFNHPGIIRSFNPYLRTVGNEFRSQLLSTLGQSDDSQHSAIDINDKSTQYPCLFVSLELCSSSLEQLLASRFVSNERLSIFKRQLASALGAIHKEKLSHRDICKSGGVFDESTDVFSLGLTFAKMHITATELELQSMFETLRKEANEDSRLPELSTQGTDKDFEILKMCGDNVTAIDDLRDLEPGMLNLIKWMVLDAPKKRPKAAAVSRILDKIYPPSPSQ